MSLFIFFLLLLSCSSANGELQPLRSLTLDVIRADYIHAEVGIPERHIRLKLDPSLDSIYLLSSFHSSSDSYLKSESHSLEHSDCYFGSEIFTLGGDTRVRLDVLYECSPPTHSKEYLKAADYYGVLGLGAGSPLWKHWKRATLCSWALYLGEHALHQALWYSSSANTLPMNSEWQQPLTAWRKKKEYHLQLQPSSEFSYMDDNATDGTPLLWTHEDGAPALLLHPNYDFVAQDSAREPRNVIKPLHMIPSTEDGGYGANGTDIVIGAWAWRHSILFLETRGSKHYWSMLPGYCSFAAPDPPTCVLFIGSLIGSVLFVFWLFACYASDVSTTVSALLRVLVKCALLVLSISIIVTHSVGFQGWRLLSAHLRYDATVAYMVLLVLLVAAVAVDCSMLIHWYLRGGSPVLLQQNRCLVDSIVLLSIWFAILEHVPCTSSRSSLLIIALALSIVNFMKLYEALSIHCNTGLLLCYVPLSLLSGLFLLLWNVEPLLHTYFRYSALHVSIYLGSLVAVFFAAFYGFTLTALSSQKHALVLLHKHYDEKIKK